MEARHRGEGAGGEARRGWAWDVIFITTVSWGPWEGGKPWWPRLAPLWTIILGRREKAELTRLVGWPRAGLPEPCFASPGVCGLVSSVWGLGVPARSHSLGQGIRAHASREPGGPRRSPASREHVHRPGAAHGMGLGRQLVLLGGPTGALMGPRPAGSWFSHTPQPVPGKSFPVSRFRAEFRPEAQWESVQRTF